MWCTPAVWGSLSVVHTSCLGQSECGAHQLSGAVLAWCTPAVLGSLGVVHTSCLGQLSMVHTNCMAVELTGICQEQPSAHWYCQVQACLTVLTDLSAASNSTHNLASCITLTTACTHSLAPGIASGGLCKRCPQRQPWTWTGLGRNEVWTEQGSSSDL